MSFWKTFLKRLKGKTPGFFKKIRVFMGGVLASGVSLMPFKDELPEELKFLPILFIIVGTVGTINNSLPVKDPNIKDDGN